MYRGDDPVGCQAKGFRDAWTGPPKYRMPVCNRPAGHEGPHRRYDNGAVVLAEWPNHHLSVVPGPDAA